MFRWNKCKNALALNDADMSLNVIGIGEVLWDLLPSGPQLGGAPANFACHARSLGANAHVITRVGEDSLGREILRRFEQMKIADGLVQIDDLKPTGSVTVSLQAEGVPQFTILENVAWDQIIPTDRAMAAAREAQAVCFGSLAQRNSISRLAIQQLVSATAAEALRIFDINLRQDFYSRATIECSLQLANILKLNDSELGILAGMFDLGTSTRQRIEQLSQNFGLRLVALTRGPHGSLLYEKGRWSEQLSRPMEVVDTVGAGDAFVAGLAVGLLKEMELDEVHAAATDVARYVCSQAGATPDLPQPIQNKFLSFAPQKSPALNR